MASRADTPADARRRRLASAIAPVARSDRRTTAMLLPLIFVTYLTFLPPQVALSVGGVVLPFYRIGLIAITPLLVLGWMRTDTKVSTFDWLMLSAVAYIFVSLSNTEGLQRAVLNGGSTALDVSIAYFLARYSIKTRDDIRLFLILVAPGFFVAAAFVAAEMVAGRYLIQPFAAQMFGQASEGAALENLASPRFGLLRGTGTFPHPILAGLHLASLLSLYALTQLRGWPRVAGLGASLAAITSLSSAAIIMLAAQVGALVYNRAGAIFPQLSWRLALLVLVVFVIALEFSSQRGSVRTLMTLTALDPWTAYFRTLIWDYGVLNVQAHPWFGIGFAEWERPAWMPPSIDNQWLVLAVQYGLPEAVLRFIIPFAAAVVLFYQSSTLSLREQSMARGVAFSVLFFTILGFSVAFWNNTQAWFNILTGIAVSLCVINAQTMGKKPNP